MQVKARRQTVEKPETRLWLRDRVVCEYLFVALALLLRASTVQLLSYTWNSS